MPQSRRSVRSMCDATQHDPRISLLMPAMPPRTDRANWLLGSVSVIALTAALAAPAVAQTWNGGSGSWSIPGNWTPATSPNSGSASAIVNSGTANVNGGFTVGTLAIGGAGSAVGIDDNQSLTVNNIISINPTGVLSLNSSNDGTDLVIGGSTVSLLGGGQVVLSNNSQNYIYGASAANTLDNAGVTISGAGHLGDGQMTLINQATINANLSTPLILNTAANVVSNSGLIVGSAGAGLYVQGGTDIDSSGGGTVSGTGGAGVVMNGATLTGGTLTGLVQVAGGTNVLDGTAGKTVNNQGAIQINDNTALYAQGVINNTGSITLNSTNDGTPLIINSPTMTLQGGGKVVMSNNFQNLIYGASGSNVLNNVDNTISGSGQLGANQLTLTNGTAGVIDANQSTELRLEPSGGVTNQGLIEATTGGFLRVYNTTVNNTATGTIQSVGAGANVELDSTTISGGTLVSSGGGVLQNVSNSTLDGSSAPVTLNGSLSVDDTTTLNLKGTINNTGTIGLNSTNDGTSLIVNSPTVTLQGGGHVTLSNNFQNYIYGTSGSNVLDNVNNTISGSGQLGANQLTLINEAAGVIDANQSTELRLEPSGGITNKNIIEATAGGFLRIYNTTVSNTATGTIQSVGAGANIELDAATISGGTLVTSGGGVLQNVSNSTLDGSSAPVTLNGSLSVDDNTTVNLKGTINNTGTIGVNSSNDGTSLIVNSPTVTLQGGGQVQLSNNPQNYIYGASASNTLVNVNNTISGAGHLGDGQMTLINQATINANQTNSLILNTASNPVTNSGLIESTSGGGLYIQGGTDLDSSSGGTVTGTGGPGVVLNGGTLTGGTLTGLVQVAGGTNVLDGTGGKTVNNQGAVQVDDNTTLFVQGVINNTGSITLNSSNDGTFLRLSSGTVTLQGGGQVILSNNSQNYVYGNTAGDTLNNVDNTISGAGQLGDGQMTLNNQATINANQTHSLILNTAGNAVTNSGLIESTSGGGLYIQGGTDVDSSSGGTVTGTGGPGVVLNGGTLTGGTLTGLVQVAGGTNVLDGTAGKTVNNQGAVQVNDNTTLNLQGVINNTGSITVNSSNDGTFLRLNSSTVTLQGGGQVTLSNNSQNYIVANVAGNTLNNVDNTISGAGQFGNGTVMPLLNGGTVNANVSNSLVVNLGGATSTNNGLMEGTGSGGLVLQNGSYTNNGTVLAGDGSGVTYQPSAINQNASGGTLTGGTWNAVANGHGAALSITGGPITTDAANMTLSGAGSLIQAYNGSSYVDIQNSLTSVAAGGQLHVLNGQNYTTNTSSNAMANAGLVDLGGGTFKDSSFVNSGTLNGFGTFTNTAVGPVANSGSVVATGGNLVLSQGVTGTTGNVTIANGASLDISGATAGNTVGTLLHNGANLNLGSQNITVSQDYNSVNFGTGNNFANHGSVTGTGLILAAGNTGLSVTGSLISGGTLALGSVHTGTPINSVIDITNTGTSGPVLRGAIQNTGITDPALSLAASNYGPLGLGATTTASLAFNPAAAGSLSGQSFKVVTNFDNVAPQTVAVTGTAWNLANPIVTPGSIAFGNVHVGDSVTPQAVTVQNATVSNPAFQEGLDASIATSSAGVTTNSGSFSNLAAGISNSSSLAVGISTATAGAISGTASVSLTSNGSTTSHLASTPLAAQTVNVTGGVYNYATSNAIAPVNMVLHVGDGGGSVSQALTITNTAPVGAFSEGLDSSFGAYTPSGGSTITPTFTGAITNLAAGSTDNSSMDVTVNTTKAGTFNGNVAVDQASDGATTSHLGVTPLTTQNVGVSGNVSVGIFTYATAAVNNTLPINFGNVRIGSSVPTQSLSISNTASAAPTTEALDGAVVSAPTGFNASGSFNGLAAGAPPDTTIQVGMNTSNAGAQSGNVVLQFKSDGSAVAGDGTVTTLTPNTNVAVQGNVYRLANPTLNTGAVTLAARVGGALPTANVSVTNTSPDIYTEALKAGFGTAPAGFTNGGSITGLAATNTSASNLSVGLASTGTSGITTGSATVNYISTGAGTDGAADIADGSGTVALTGKVYQTATASVTPSVNFGIVHVGDTVAPQAVTVANTASGALVDSIIGGMAVSGAPFSVVGGGTLSPVAAGTNSGSTLQVGLSTSSAGVFTGGSAGSANLTLASHDSDLADVALTTGPVSLNAQVNNYAAIGLANATKGTLSGGGSAYTLNLGTLTKGSSPITAAIDALNAVLGPADALSVSSFNILSGSGFGLALNAFSNLVAAGTDSDALDVTLNPTAAGFFTEEIQLIGIGSNASGWDSGTNVLDPTLIIDAKVAAGTTGVPEPASWATMLTALAGLVGAARPWRRRQARSGTR
jgi:hypothetical protein